ncbi:MAG: hypothetical protein QNJ62_05210 [Methyloceanibacter sp.]|nr:hypothetical protein [Methyloceanibacter sp.]
MTEVRLPDGRVVKAPDNATREQIIEFVQSQGLVQPQEPDRSLFRRADDFVRSLAEGATLGFADEIAAGLNTVTGLGSGDLSENLAAERERDRAIPTSTRLAGNVIGGLAVPGGAARTIPGAIGRGAGFGGVAGFGAGEGGLEQRLETARTGALTGGAVGGGLGAASRAISPRVSPDVVRLQAEGVRPTAGQITGSAGSAIEQRAASLPILGDAIRTGRTRALNDFNRAAINQAVRGSGVQLPRNAEMGRKAIASVEKQLGNRFEDILSRIPRVRADSQFADDVRSATEIANRQTEGGRGVFDQALSDLIDVVSKAERSRGAITGKEASRLVTNLRTRADSFRNAPDPLRRDIAQPLDDLREAFEDLLSRSTTPENAQALQNVRRAWAGFSRIRDASTRAGSKDGIFTPAALKAAARSADRSVGRGRFARGDALLQELAEDAERVLGNTVPDSGTAERVMQGALGTSALFDPVTTGLAAGGAGVLSLPFTRPGQALTQGALTGRQSLPFRATSEAVRRVLPGASIGAAQEQARRR